MMMVMMGRQYDAMELVDWQIEIVHVWVDWQNIFDTNGVIYMEQLLWFVLVECLSLLLEVVSLRRLPAVQELQFFFPNERMKCSIAIPMCVIVE